MFRMNSYQRYLIRETFASVFLVLAAFLALFAFFNFIDELRSVGKAGYSVVHAALFVTLSMPGLVYELIPIATLIGTLYALSTLARHSEITVLRASGLATADLLMTLFRVAALLALLTIVVGEALVPWTERVAQELKAKALSRVIAQQGFDSGLWVKDVKSFINIRSATPDARLERLRIYRFDGSNALQSVTDAATAEYDLQRGWHLQEVVRT